MSEVSSTGNSALRSLAQQLMAAERRPLTSMQTQRSGLQEKSTVFRNLGSTLSTLKRLASTFATSSSSNPLRTIKVTGQDDAVLGVTVGLGASPGAHTIRVDQVAARHSLASASVQDDGTSLSASPLLAAGELRFAFTVGEETKEVAISLEAGATDLEVLRDVAQAITDADVGAVASVVQTSPGESRLLVQAAESGRDARLTAIGDVAGSLMNSLGLAGREGDGSPLPATVQEGVDALVRLDGLDVRARSNELVGVVPGVTLTLHATSSEARTFRVDRDNEAIVKKLEEFITKYNETLDSVRNLTRASDSSGANRGPLTGEVTILRLRTEMRSAVTASVESDDSALTTLAQIGITADREGNLSLSDRSALQKALADNPDGVEALMNGTDGVAHRLTSLLDRYSKAGGILSLQQDAVQSRLRSLGTRMQRQSESLAKREDALVTRLSQLEAGLVALSQQQSSLNGLLGTSDSLFA